MPFVSCHVDHVFALRWNGIPTEADADRLLREVLAARKGTDEKLALLAILPSESTAIPPAEVRARMQELMPRLIEELGMVAAVIEGDGLMTSLIRTALRGMLVISRTQMKLVFHDNIEDALVQLQSALPNGVSSARRIMREKGLAGAI